jgi:hypothetical protein
MIHHKFLFRVIDINVIDINWFRGGHSCWFRQFGEHLLHEFSVAVLAVSITVNIFASEVAFSSYVPELRTHLQSEAGQIGASADPDVNLTVALRDTFAKVNVGCKYTQ